MKLEEGMYVRTYEGIITKIISLSIGEEEECCFIELSKRRTGIKEHNITKASYNIIDLIEIGDIITTNNLCGEVTKIDIENNEIWIACCDYETCRSEDIKSIVTKEQFETMQYKVVE